MALIPTYVRNTFTADNIISLGDFIAQTIEVVTLTATNVNATTVTATTTNSTTINSTTINSTNDNSETVNTTNVNTTNLTSVNSSIGNTTAATINALAINVLTFVEANVLGAPSIQVISPHGSPAQYTLKCGYASLTSTDIENDYRTIGFNIANPAITSGNAIVVHSASFGYQAQSTPYTANSVVYQLVFVDVDGNTLANIGGTVAANGFLTLANDAVLTVSNVNNMSVFQNPQNCKGIQLKVASASSPFYPTVGNGNLTITILYSIVPYQPAF